MAFSNSGMFMLVSLKPKEVFVAQQSVQVLCSARAEQKLAQLTE